MATINLTIEFADSYLPAVKAFMVSRAGEFTGGQTTITDQEAVTFIGTHFQLLADRFAASAVDHAESSSDRTTLPAGHQTALTALETAEANLETERGKARP